MCQISKGEKEGLAKGSSAMLSFHRMSRKWRQRQCLEIDQAKGMAWKITFHLPSEAIKHERKFPKEE